MMHSYFSSGGRAGGIPARLAGAAATGFIVGLAANLGRKAVVQSPTLLQGYWDEGLQAEHRMTLGIFDAIEATRNDQPRKRAALLLQLRHALAKHAFEEENIVYPALRDHGLSEEADQLNHDHGYVKQHLYRLGETDAADLSWMETIRQFREELESHIRSEEEELFPKLRSALGEDGNKHLTAAMNKAGFAAA